MRARSGPVVPSLDQVRLVEAVANRQALLRSEPHGVPRAPTPGDLVWLANKLRGRVPQTVSGILLKRGVPVVLDNELLPGQSPNQLRGDELEAIREAWAAERARHPVGGAHGLTTQDYDQSRDPWERFDAAYRRIMGRR